MKYIFFVYNSKKDNCLNTVNEVLTFLMSKDVDIFVECKDLSQKYSLKMIDEEDLNKCDLAVILGGDGTILKFCREYGKYEIPILGINIGRVGALATAKLDNYKELIDKYLSDDYLITNNLTLKCSIKYHSGTYSEDFVVYNSIQLLLLFYLDFCLMILKYLSYLIYM